MSNKYKYVEKCVIDNKFLLVLHLIAGVGGLVTASLIIFGDTTISAKPIVMLSSLLVGSLNLAMAANRITFKKVRVNVDEIDPIDKIIKRSNTT